MIIDKPLQYVGRGIDSKSLLNRAWLVKSYFPDFNIIGSSEAEDVRIIENAVQSYLTQDDIYCGQSATAFRFMALRVSRQKGKYRLTGEPSLFTRPHQVLVSILGQLGVHCEFKENQFIINSQGWNLGGDALTFSSHYSSQFASSVLLNSFNLDRDLFLSLEGDIVSSAYLEMTLSFLKNIGMVIHRSGKEFHIPKMQKINQTEYKVESDMSCLFSLSCFVALRGQAIFSSWPKHSIQPDFIFPQILKDMGVPIEVKDDTLIVKAAPLLSSINIDLNSNPDLFPSLAILCSLCDGESLLSGVSHVQYKESRRLDRISDLIHQAGRSLEETSNGILIKGSSKKGRGRSIVCNPKSDHRIAMAACLLSYYGFDTRVTDTKCTKKSFPEFCNIIKYV